jgi:predicted RNase H-like HicB family nuclease
MNRNAHRHRHSEAHRYLKLVRWSEDDQAYIGSCPPIIGDCCHGDTEAEVINQLVVVVDAWIDAFKADDQPLPPGTNHDYSGKLTLRVNPGLHRALALRATAAGSSLNSHIERVLAESLA